MNRLRRYSSGTLIAIFVAATLFANEAAAQERDAYGRIIPGTGTTSAKTQPSQNGWSPTMQPGARDPYGRVIQGTETTGTNGQSRNLYNPNYVPGLSTGQNYGYQPANPYPSYGQSSGGYSSRPANPGFTNGQPAGSPSYQYNPGYSQLPPPPQHTIKAYRSKPKTSFKSPSSGLNHGGYDDYNTDDIGVLEVTRQPAPPTQRTGPPMTKYCGCMFDHPEMFGICRDTPDYRATRAIHGDKIYDRDKNGNITNVNSQYTSGTYNVGYYPWTPQCKLPKYR